MKSNSSRQGFTLIELLIVTVVIATLMGIVFRLAGVGGDNRAKAQTVKRMQCIENALSGYYAAYGSYPPVPLQGRSRSIYKKVDGLGLQNDGDKDEGESFPGGTDANAAWNKIGKQIEAACKAQPVAVCFPFNSRTTQDRKMVEALNKARAKISGHVEFSLNPLRNAGGFKLESDDWREFSVFQFGLLSFLLPRYLFMLEGEKDFYDYVDKNGRRCGQWASNNQLPCRMDTGDQYESWEKMQQALKSGSFASSGGNTTGSLEGNMVSNLTSQSVCARWMPNFEGIISGGRVFYGINTANGDQPYLTASADHKLELHSKNGYSGGSGTGGQVYLLDCMTVRDGWGHDFYYYSEPPYQSYRLWSAGPNGKTFPVWYDLSDLNASQRKIVQAWTEDDIIGLNN